MPIMENKEKSCSLREPIRLLSSQIGLELCSLNLTESNMPSKEGDSSPSVRLQSDLAAMQRHFGNMQGLVHSLLTRKAPSNCFCEEHLIQPARHMRYSTAVLQKSSCLARPAFKLLLKLHCKFRCCSLTVLEPVTMDCVIAKGSELPPWTKTMPNSIRLYLPFRKQQPLSVF